MICHQEPVQIEGVREGELPSLLWFPNHRVLVGWQAFVPCGRKSDHIRGFSDGRFSCRTGVRIE